MNIKHHPDEATILAYAAGTLDEAFAVLVSCHMETCSHCRDRLETAEMIGAEVLEASDDVSVADGSLGRILEKISADARQTHLTMAESPSPSEFDRGEYSWSGMPRALHGYVPGKIDELHWKRVGPGVWQKAIELSPGARSSLRFLRIARGKSVPEHGHGGQELTLILRGAYRDKFGHFGPGDVADLDDDVEHQPIVVSDEDCICLAATEAPTRFKGLAGRLLQPLIGI